MAAGISGGVLDNGGERLVLTVTGATSLGGTPVVTIVRTPGGTATAQDVSIQGQTKIVAENFLDGSSNPVYVRDGESLIANYASGLTDSGTAVTAIPSIPVTNTSEREPIILGGDWFKANQDLGGDRSLSPLGEGEGEFGKITRTDTNSEVALVQFTDENWTWPVTLQVGVPYRFDVYDDGAQRIIKTVSFQQ